MRCSKLSACGCHGHRPRRREARRRIGSSSGFGSALTDAGIPRLPARVFAALLADDDGRMTAAELGEALEVSPASVSGAVRISQQMHMICTGSASRQPRATSTWSADDAWHDAMINARRSTTRSRGAGRGVDLSVGRGSDAGARSPSVEFLELPRRAR